MRTITKISAVLGVITISISMIFAPVHTCGNADLNEDIVHAEEITNITTYCEHTVTTCTTAAKYEPEYPISESDINLIALITMGEAEGETELGKRLVIDTILNRMDNPAFPDTVYDVIYYPSAFSCVWDGRIERCSVTPEMIELVKEELLERTNNDCVFFMAYGYSDYGVPMFQEYNHYFSSWE